ncbi:MAG: N-6 DNA methylase, partial [Chloroflexota bacterium]
GRESERGNLHEWFAAFQETLIPDLTPAQFADMFAQTIAYGMFAARANDPTPKDFSRMEAAFVLPKTNPFLRKLFHEIAGPDLDPRVAWIADDLANLLARADMERVLKDFGKRTKREDPVVHFYETFLAAYDARLRKARGVYYTPEPVVSYIVRSVDYLLRKEFGKANGLADPSVLLLDPAVGTATFLYFVIQQIHETLTAQGQQGAWAKYVAEKLLPRLFGFEILMAPYTVAHLKLGIELKDLGYDFAGDERLGIYLTNSLEQIGKESQLHFARFINEESEKAQDIKRNQPIMVVLGNPPYANFGMMNKGEWIGDLLDDYKRGLREKKLNLDDDFIKFLRFGQWRIERSGAGILALITNNTYIDGITHRRMRQSLLETFDDIYILDLHGSSKKKEKCPDGSKDENVFDIQQGVAIALFVRRRGV